MPRALQARQQGKGEVNQNAPIRLDCVCRSGPLQGAPGQGHEWRGSRSVRLLLLRRSVLLLWRQQGRPHIPADAAAGGGRRRYRPDGGSGRRATRLRRLRSVFPSHAPALLLGCRKPLWHSFSTGEPGASVSAADPAAPSRPAAGAGAPRRSPAGPPPPRDQAFEQFKSGPGAEKSGLLEENKGMLKAAKKRLREVGLQVNAAKKDIDEASAGGLYSWVPLSTAL